MLLRLLATFHAHLTEDSHAVEVTNSQLACRLKYLPMFFKQIWNSEHNQKAPTLVMVYQR